MTGRAGCRPIFNVGDDVVPAGDDVSTNADNQRRRFVKSVILDPVGSEATEGCRGSMPEREPTGTG
jgi:hypothetical protein